MNKKFKDLDLSNAFLFAAALEDEEICRLILEIILDRKISHVDVHPEHSIQISADYRSVRLDVYASDDMCVTYNMEMQNSNKHNLAKRSRMHQAEMDVASIKPGEDFNSLKPSFIIFICTFDPFGQGLYRYTFETLCRENGICLEDGICKIFLNTKGRNEDDVPIELIHFLKYVEHSTDDYVAQTKDASIARLHEKVSALKKWRKLEERYVTLEEYLNDQIDIAKAEALAEGIAQGKERGLAIGLEQGLKQGKAQGLEQGKAQGLEQGKAQGLALGKIESILELLMEYGEVPQNLRDRILAEQDCVILSSWLKSAARSSNIQQFRNETNI